jgi:hypothetical protein
VREWPNICEREDAGLDASACAAFSPSVRARRFHLLSACPGYPFQRLLDHAKYAIEMRKDPTHRTTMMAHAVSVSMLKTRLYTPLAAVVAAEGRRELEAMVLRDFLTCD